MEVIVKANTIGYFQTILAGARKAAAQFGVQSLGFTGANAEYNVAGQIRLLEDAIARHPDFIVLAPTAIGALNAPVVQAHRVGIKVIIVDSPLLTPDDRPADTNDYQTYLATDYYKGACNAANALAAAIRAKTGKTAGQVAYTTLDSVPNPQLVASRKGFTDCIAHYPAIHIVRHLDAGGDLTKTESVAASILATFPALVGFYADSTFTLQGAARAFAQRKVDHGKVSLVGMQGYDLAGRDLKAHKLDGVILQDPFAMGYGGVIYGILAAAGLNVPTFVDSGTVLATPANVSSPFIQGLLTNSNQQPGIGF
jgi:ribose transport system substrate-binding protein